MNLCELKRLCDEATPGPWEMDESWCGPDAPNPGGICGDNCMDVKDAKFCAAARGYMPALIEIARTAFILIAGPTSHSLGNMAQLGVALKQFEEIK